MPPQIWLLHNDNAASHTFVLTQQFLAKNKMHVIPHPLYSPELAPCDFFLFPNTKLKMKGRRFDSTDEIQAESQRVLDTLDRTGLPGSVPKMEETVGLVSTCGTTSRVMATDRPYGEFYDFHSFSPEYFGLTLSCETRRVYRPCIAEWETLNLSNFYFFLGELQIDLERILP
jgi:hypothetical protein